MASMWRRFRYAPEIGLYRHNASGLMHFSPSVIGDDKLYEQLESIDWYYLDDKWEYDHALSLMGGREHVLEVGCERGAFLNAIKNLGHEHYLAEGEDHHEVAKPRHERHPSVDQGPRARGRNCCLSAA